MALNALQNRTIAPVIASVASRAAATPRVPFLNGLAIGLAAVATCVALAFGAGDPPKAPPRDGKIEAKRPSDAEGVALPDCAIARLGSARFRHSGWPYCPPVFSPDGRLLASADQEGARVFEVATGRTVQQFQLATGQMPMVIRFAPEGRLVVGASNYAQVAQAVVFDLATGKQLAEKMFAAASPTSQIFVRDISPDGQRVLVLDHSKRVFLWDFKTASEVWSFDQKEGTGALKFTADGRRIGSASSREVLLRDADNGAVVERFRSPDKVSWNGHSATLSGTGRFALVDSKDQSIALLDPVEPTGNKVLPANVASEVMNFSPDGRLLVGCARYQPTTVWDSKTESTRAVVARLPTCTTASFSPDGKLLATDLNGAISIWEVGTWKRMPVSADPTSTVYHLRISSDGRNVYGHTVEGWAAWPIVGGPGTRLTGSNSSRADGDGDISPNGRFAVQGMRVYDINRKSDRQFDDILRSARSARISTDGRTVSCLLNGDLAVFDVATRNEIARRNGPKNGLTFGYELSESGRDIDLTVTGRFVENGFDDRSPLYSEVIVADHRTGRNWILEPMPWTIGNDGIKFSRDRNRLLVVGRPDGDSNQSGVGIWDTKTGRQLASFRRDRLGLADSVALSDDGRSVVFGYSSGILQVGEVASGGIRAEFRHASQIDSATFDATASRVVAASAEAPIYVWDLIGPAEPWDAAKADALWVDLASKDARVAFAAIRRLRTNPKEAIAFLRERMHLSKTPSAESVDALIKALDADAFATREKAQRELIGLADQIGPRLAEAKKVASTESVGRLEQIIDSARTLTPERLRTTRACEVLESLGTEVADAVLHSWSAGPAGSRLAVEASESLARRRR